MELMKLTPYEKEKFDEICEWIDKIKTPSDFYEIIDFLFDNYDAEVVMAARNYKQCFSSAQYF